MDNPIIIVLIIIIALFFVVFIVKSASGNKGEKRVPNYRALFIPGVTWLPIGIGTDSPGLWGMGIVFMLIGGANKDKWGKETKWTELSPVAKRIKIILVGGLTVVLLAALVYFIITK
jgi:hypothetical protein